MTNGSKFKTAHERENAFWDFCEKNVCLNGCPLYKSLCDETRAKRTNSICHFAWLDLECEEEKPLPCPFCGGETIVRANWNSTHQVVCNSQGCWYCSKCETTKSDAIAAHNRVAKAVKESEANHEAR